LSTTRIPKMSSSTPMRPSSSLSGQESNYENVASAELVTR
jgi:hypothetical protein